MSKIILDPTEVLERKTAYALKELQKDTPLVALSSPAGVYLASYSNSQAHQKVVELNNFPGALVILGGVGNQSDLTLLKGELRRFITAYEQFVHRKDISGRLIASTAAAILRQHFLESPKPLCVRVVIVDPHDPECPFCALSFNGEEKVSKNLCMDGEGVHLVAAEVHSVKEMKRFAKRYLKKPPHYLFQSSSFEISKKDKTKEKKL